MQLNVLVDNHTYIDQYYYGEPAVSYYIETGKTRLLFDTGYSDILLKNAKNMQIPLDRLTHIVLSHGHNDHSGGLRYLCDALDLSHTELLAHPDCFLPKYDGAESIGAPLTAEILSGRLLYHPCSKPYQIQENLTFLGEIPRINDFENPAPIGNQLRSGQWEPDRLLDDSALVYQNTDGIFIITGCSHSGICNIIDYAKKVCNEPRILGVLGGFHLFDYDSRVKNTIQYLESCNIRRLYPCHCVSLQVKAKLMEKLPVAEVGVGMTIRIE